MSFRFTHQHHHMVELADAILSVARDAPPDATERLTTARLKLSREVSEHCRDELADLQARRPDVGDAREQALVRKYHDDLLAWRHDLIACNSNWPPARVLNEPRAFAAEFSPIAERLRERVRWEEEEFYPAVLYARAA